MAHSNYDRRNSRKNVENKKFTKKPDLPTDTGEEDIKLSAGYVTDENGQIKLLPLKHPNIDTASKITRSQSPRKRKYIPIERLSMAPLQVKETSPHLPLKKLRTEKQPPKESFKVPRQRRLSFVTKKSTRTLNKGKNKPAGSPLIELDHAEEILRKIKIVKTPNIIVTEYKTPPKLAALKEEESPRSSDHEFLELEKNCATPMTAMCQLLENTKIDNLEGSASTISQIQALVKQNENELIKMKEHIENFEKNHRQLVQALEQLENSESSNNKENFKRVPTPSVSSQVDLRKFTLNKNFTNPRLKKAADLYNTIRNDCTVLCTPKMERTGGDLYQSNITRSLSRRIKNQCLLLQDTPR